MSDGFEIAEQLQYMKRIIILVASLAAALSLSSCSSKSEFTGSDIKSTIQAHKSWQILADWNFGYNSQQPTRFQGKAYYTKNGLNYVWVDHGMGSTIPMKVENGLLYAPMESPPINGKSVKEDVAASRISHDLFNHSPLEMAIESKVIFKLATDKKYKGSINCDVKLKKKYNCLRLDFELSLDKNKNPETLLLFLMYSPNLGDKISFYYNMYDEVTMNLAEESTNFKNLTPPDYEAIAANLDKDKIEQNIKVMKEQEKTNKKK